MLEICDDGVGFNPNAPPAVGSRHGLGLLGMRERMRMVGGELTIVSNPGRGTQVQARVPIPADLLHPNPAAVTPAQADVVPLNR